MTIIICAAYDSNQMWDCNFSFEDFPTIDFLKIKVPLCRYRSHTLWKHSKMIQKFISTIQTWIIRYERGKSFKLKSIVSAVYWRTLLNFSLVQILPNLTPYNTVHVFSKPSILFSKVPGLANFQRIVYPMD